jgi:hypothetical protein
LKRAQARWALGNVRILPLLFFVAMLAGCGSATNSSGASHPYRVPPQEMRVRVRDQNHCYTWIDPKVRTKPAPPKKCWKWLWENGYNHHAGTYPPGALP